MIGRLSILALIMLVINQKSVKEVVSSSLEKSQENYALPSCTPIITFSETPRNPSRMYTYSRKSNIKIEHTSVSTISYTSSPTTAPMQTRI